MKYIFIVTARSGSKGIPNKNILEVGGKSVLDYTLKAADEASKTIDAVIILSSDSGLILSYADKYEKVVKDLRPPHLARDDSKSVDVVIDAIDRYLDGKSDISNYSVVLLQPTSPLRTSDNIIESIRLFETSGKESLISGYLDGDGLLNKLYALGENEIVPQYATHNSGTPRQKIEKLFIRNGAIYIAEYKYILKSKRFFSDNPAHYIMEKRSSLDLNDSYDLDILRCLLK
jgi:CMP-N,N'-diacetyllegionaminic acid synthase